MTRRSPNTSIATAMLLLRGAYGATAEVVAGAWPRNRLMGREIAGKRLGLVGFGAIARETGRRAAALGMEVTAYDPHLPADDAAWCQPWGDVAREPLETLLSACGRRVAPRSADGRDPQPDRRRGARADEDRRHPDQRRSRRGRRRGGARGRAQGRRGSAALRSTCSRRSRSRQQGAGSSPSCPQSDPHAAHRRGQRRIERAGVLGHGAGGRGKHLRGTST